MRSPATRSLLTPLSLRESAFARRAALSSALFASIFAAACDSSAWDDGDAEGAVTGIARDALTGELLAGVEVSAPDLRLAATTDARGRFELHAPPGALRLEYARADYFEGYREDVVIRTRRYAAADLELAPRAPSDDAVHGWLDAIAPERTALRDNPSDPALRPEVAAFLRGELRSLRAHREEHGDVAAARQALGAPPATIRIWRRALDAAASSCVGRVDVIPFEEYVKGVLPHEWIPSWHAESLEAGSLAIRTYAWNWIANGGKFDCADLDDTTRSQVYADDWLDVTNAAVGATTGEVVVRGDTMVSGEYSAENSSPTADGIDDRPCVGHALAGHGRGMCQWGSQRWALMGQTHVWIAQHYWPGATIAGGTPPLDAALVSDEHPMEMTSGDVASVTITMHNSGGGAWTDAVALRTMVPDDHTSPFSTMRAGSRPLAQRTPTAAPSRPTPKGASRS